MQAARSGGRQAAAVCNNNKMLRFGIAASAHAALHAPIPAPGDVPCQVLVCGAGASVNHAHTHLQAARREEQCRCLRALVMVRVPLQAPAAAGVPARAIRSCRPAWTLCLCPRLWRRRFGADATCQGSRSWGRTARHRAPLRAAYLRRLRRCRRTVCTGTRAPPQQQLRQAGAGRRKGRASGMRSAD